MASEIRKFINPKFLRTIDLTLMRDLFARHFSEAELPFAFDGTIAEVRAALTAYFDDPVTDWSEGLVADLHRVAELGTGEGMQLILNDARRQGITLFPEPNPETAGSAPPQHDPKHVALYTYLHHHPIFQGAADFQALRAPTAMAEFRGPERNVGADLLETATEAFRQAIVPLFAQDLQGEYCRLGPYEEEDEINLVVSHGAPVTTTPVVAGDGEEIITLRAVQYTVLRYSPTEGLLRIGGVPKARQEEVAELFATHILGRPGFFAGKDARDLYTLAPIMKFGWDFAFDHAFDDRIAEVRIVAAAADLFAEDDAGRRHHVRSWESKDASGRALQHFQGSEVRFRRDWQLGEITFRVFFRNEGKRPAQVTVRLKPPGTLAFRRTRYERAIHSLVARNGLEKDRDAGLAVAAAQ